MVKGADNLPLVWNLPINPVAHKDFQKRPVKPVTMEDCCAPEKNYTGKCGIIQGSANQWGWISF